MSAPSDPAGLTSPQDPAAYRRRGASTISAWATIAFGVFCVLAGAGAAVMAPRLFMGAQPPLLPTLAAPSVPPPLAPQPLAASVSPPAPELAPTADMARLSARIAALEAQEARVNQAAAEALAAAALTEATQTSRPFAAELSALRAAAPTTPELATLARLADTGAPSRAALAASFPDYAARAARASHAPGPDAGLSQQIVYALMRIVTVRQVGDVPGDSSDALIARAERRVQEGDIAAALETLDRLSPAARDALAPWRAGAARRAEIDRLAAAMSGRALHTLTALQRGGA